MKRFCWKFKIKLSSLIRNHRIKWFDNPVIIWILRVQNIPFLFFAHIWLNKISISIMDLGCLARGDFWRFFRSIFLSHSLSLPFSRHLVKKWWLRPNEPMDPLPALPQIITRASMEHGGRSMVNQHFKASHSPSHSVRFTHLLQFYHYYYSLLYFYLFSLIFFKTVFFNFALVLHISRNIDFCIFSSVLNNVEAFCRRGRKETASQIEK